MGRHDQHVQETGQSIPDAAKSRAFELTQGQPWLVNALARQALSDQDPSEEIDREAVELAKEALILRRDTHLD